MATASKKAVAGESTLALMLAKLETSCLNELDAKKLHMKPASMDELQGFDLPAKKAFEIPYFATNGKPTDFKRYRYLEDTRNGIAKQTDAKPMRYAQARNTMSEVYLPPLVNWETIFGDVTQALVITEGELKAACATKFGHPCIGLGGVYSFRSTRKNAPLLPIFHSIKWSGRNVYVIYDSDACTNPMVVSARNALCKALLGLGALPFVADLPTSEDGMKQGIDDLILNDGPDALDDVLTSAVAFSAAEALFGLNEEVAYIIDPGCIVVLNTGKAMRPYDFTTHAYANWLYTEYVQTVSGMKPVVKQAAVEWLKWENRLALERMTYKPGDAKITEKREFNTWPGWGCMPKKGDIKPWVDLLNHVFPGQPVERDWMERWCAYPIQNPGAKMHTSAVIWGRDTGTGKSTIGYALARVYGSNFIEVGPEALKDGRNEWAQNKQFVLGDDITGTDQRAYADKLKRMITQLSIRIDPKFIQSFSIPDCINYLFTSNHPDAFFIEDDDRRMFIHEVRNARLTVEFYRTFYTWLDNGGAEALYYHLLQLDLKGMKAQDRAPDTQAKSVMIEDGLSDMGRWVRRLMDDPDLVLKLHNMVLPGDLWSSTDLLSLYDPELRGKVTSGGLGKELKRAGFKQIEGGAQVRTCKGQQRLFIVRNFERWHKAKVGEAGKQYNKTRKEFDRKS
jgi:hypothetical protein